MTLAFVGHFDHVRSQYAGAALGKMYSNISGLSIGMGLNLGLSTLCSQAFGAGRAASLNGIYLRRCVVFLLVAFCYSAAAAFYAEPILVALQQPANVSKSSARFAQVQLGGVPFYWLADAPQTVCDGVQRTDFGFYAQALGAILQVALSLLAVHHRGLDLAYLGIAAAR